MRSMVQRIWDGVGGRGHFGCGVFVPAESVGR